MQPTGGPSGAFHYQTPAQRIVFGRGALQSLRDDVVSMPCTRVAILTGPRTAATELYAKVRTALDDLVVMEFTQVRPHSPAHETERMASSIADLAVDGLVVVGGGSVSDAAKGVAILMAEGGPLEDRCTVFEPPDRYHAPALDKPKLPIIAVPTTCSGAEMTPGGSTRLRDGTKRSIWDPMVAARLVVLDTEGMDSIPIDLILETAMNGLAHCVEGLYSRSKSPITRALALEGVELFAKAMPRLRHSPLDAEARGMIQLAGAIGGLVISNARVGIHHALCHAVGGRFALPHGAVNSVLLPHAMRFNLDVTEAEQAEVALILARGHIEDGRSAPDMVEVLRDEVGTPERLRDLGVPHDQLKEAARDTMGDRGLYFNPKPATIQDIASVLEAAW